MPRFLVEINQNAAEAIVERCPPHAVSAYSFCAGANIDSDFWGRSGLPLVLNGGGAPQLSLIIMRLTLRGVTPEIISVDAAAT